LSKVIQIYQTGNCGKPTINDENTQNKPQIRTNIDTDSDIL